MRAFEVYGVGRVIFGRGKVSAVGDIAASLGHSALVIHNGAGNVERVVDSLEKAGVKTQTRRQRGEPVVAHVDDAVEAGRDCNLVIGLGGGSAIDCAKAVAGLLASGGSAVDYLEVVGKGRKITKPAKPWIAIPTTAGTGAEATRNAVIGFPEKKFKASIRSELLLPRVAVIDPELGVGVPPAVTASSGMDALCQLIESYTSTGASPVTDALAMRGIHLATRLLRRAFEDGGDLEAREGMALAAHLSGVTLTSAGLGAVHGFAAPIGANFDVPHGTVCATLLPHIVRANVEAMRSKSDGGLTRYADVGRALPGLETAEDDAAIDALIRFCFKMVTDLKIEPLSKFAMGEMDVAEMVGLARKASSMRFNPVELSDEALAAALRGAIAGQTL